MVDIETLGMDSDSTIIQISAIAFDIKTGDRLKKFNQVADISRNENPIRVNGNTIQRWLKTNKELFSTLLHGGKFSSEQVLRNFYDWLTSLESLADNSNVYLWGNGILFDNKLIQHQFESLGLSYPIFYRNDRDLRTLVDLTCNKLGITEEELKSRFDDDSLTAHNAFDDVIYQINLATECFNILTRR